jgi:hypothetical protein
MITRVEVRVVDAAEVVESDRLHSDKRDLLGHTRESDFLHVHEHAPAGIQRDRVLIEWRPVQGVPEIRKAGNEAATPNADVLAHCQGGCPRRSVFVGDRDHGQGLQEVVVLTEPREDDIGVDADADGGGEYGRCHRILGVGRRGAPVHLHPRGIVRLQVKERDRIGNASDRVDHHVSGTDQVRGVVGREVQVVHSRDGRGAVRVEIERAEGGCVVGRSASRRGQRLDRSEREYQDSQSDRHGWASHRQDRCDSPRQGASGRLRTHFDQRADSHRRPARSRRARESEMRSGGQQSLLPQRGVACVCCTVHPCGRRRARGTSGRRSRAAMRAPPTLAGRGSQYAEHRRQPLGSPAVRPMPPGLDVPNRPGIEPGTGSDLPGSAPDPSGTG